MLFDDVDIGTSGAFTESAAKKLRTSAKQAVATPSVAFTFSPAATC